jgi:hypothetical protein
VYGPLYRTCADGPQPSIASQTLNPIATETSFEDEREFYIGTRSYVNGVHLRSEQTGAYVALDLNGQVGRERDVGARARCAHDDALRESGSREEDAHCERPEGMHHVSGVAKWAENGAALLTTTVSPFIYTELQTGEPGRVEARLRLDSEQGIFRNAALRPYSDMTVG